MPPSTALLLVLYAGAVFFAARTPGRTAYRVGMAIGVTGALLGLSLAFLSWEGVRLQAEHFGIVIPATVGGARFGHMSPVTGLCFVLTSLSLVAAVSSAPDRPKRAVAALCLAGPVMLAGMVFLLAYLFGAPLLYGGEFVPPALPTTMGLVALAAALLALAAPPTWASEERFDAAARRSSWSVVLVFALTAAGLVAVGALYFGNHERHYRRRIEHQLSTIAEMKVAELARWREERLADGRVLRRSTVFSALVRRALANPRDRQARDELQGWLRALREAEGYDGVYLVDAQGVARISLPDRSQATDATEHARETLRSGRVEFLDFHRNEAAGNSHLSVMVPLPGTDTGGRGPGVVVLDIDAAGYLYPSIERWPVPSRSAETLLVRRDGGDALVLNELRFRKNAALSLRFPLTRTDLPVVKAVLGQRGIVEGVNSKHGAVIAAVRAVPDSPWILVARMDAAELLEPIRQDLWLTASLIGSLLLAAGAATGLIWRHQRVHHYKERFRAAEALAAGAARYRAVTETAADAIVTADGAGNIVGWNAAAERMFDYAEGEALGQALVRLIPERYREGYLAGAKRAQVDGRATGGSVELHGLTKTGGEFPLELSLSRWETSEGRFVTGIIRDITKRRLAQKALARQKDLYDMLSQTNQAVVRMASGDELFPAVCRIAVEHGGFRFAWVGLIDEGRQQLKPVAEYGEDAGYVERIRVSVEASHPAGRGPAGQALRTGKHAVSNDFLNDPATAPWHEAAQRSGVRACAAFPLRERGALVGTIILSAGESGFFTEDILATLDEMALDVSFALDSYQQKAELARAVEALRTTESSYRQLFAANPHPMWVYDLETLRFLAVNDAAVTQYGYTRDEFQAMTIADIRSGEDVPRLLENVAHVEDGKLDEAGVWCHRKKDGTLIDVEITSHVLDFDGRRAEVVLAHDVTERSKAADALRASEERLRATFDQAAVGMAHVAPDGRWLRVNRKLCEIVGYTREELLARRFQDITHPDDLERDLDLMRQLLAAEIPTYSMEKRYLRKDGEIVWINLTVALVRKNSGEPRYFIAVVEDISSRRQAEEALRDAEEQFRGLVEQSIAGIYLIQNDKFAYVNPRLAEIFGYDSAEQLIGRNPASLVTEKDRGTVVENIRLWIKGEAPSIHYSFTALRKDGSTIEVGVHGARANHRGRPAIIGLIQDISEKKRAEEQIQRYVAELETAFMSTVEVATTLSEMRDPYTAGHERRVGEISVAIGAELGFDEQRLEGLRVAGYLHDIGKMTIPAEILSKPGKLTLIELQLMKGHCQASYDVLKDVKFPWPVAQIALQHHERMDGSGYPQGLKGDAILLEARITAVADVVEAMSSHRPYRPGLGLDRALAEIERGRGSAYDPMVADACLRLFQEKGYVLPA